MDEKFFSPSRFKILKELVQEKKSATDIARSINISLPYVLSQLAILEAKNIITKELPEIKNNPGKPKQYYRLTRPIVNLTLLEDGFGMKAEIKEPDKETTKYLRLISQVKGHQRHALSRYYWKYIKQFKHVHALALLNLFDDKIELVALTDYKHLEELRKHISSYKTSPLPNKDVLIACWVHTGKEFEEGCAKKDGYYEGLRDKMTTLFDSNNIINNIKGL